jgi:hypothetical protein
MKRSATGLTTGASDSHHGSPTTTTAAGHDERVAYESVPVTFGVESFPALFFAGAFMAPPMTTTSAGSMVAASTSVDGFSASSPTELASDVFITQSIGDSANFGSARSLMATANSATSMSGAVSGSDMPITLEQLRNTHRAWNTEFQMLLSSVKHQENQMKIALAAASTAVAPSTAGPPGGSGVAPSATGRLTPSQLVSSLSGPFPSDCASDDGLENDNDTELLETGTFGTFQLSTLPGSLGAQAALRGKVGASCKAAEQLMDFMSAFESEVADSTAAIIESRADPSKPLIHHMLESDHMYRHRGVCYNFFAQDRNVVNYFGSVENACKAMSCEVRTYRHLVQSLTIKSQCGIPLVALVRLQGISVLAWAHNSCYHESHVVAGPSAVTVGPNRSIRVIKHTHLREAVSNMCDEALGVQPEHSHIFVSEFHKTTHKNFPVVGSPELMVVHDVGDEGESSGGGGKLYLYNVWKLLPPVDVPRTSTSLQIVSPRSSHGQVETPATGNVRNRYHFVNRRCEQYVMFLPQALKLMQLGAARGTGPLTMPVSPLAFSSLDRSNVGAEGSRIATEWLMATQVPLAATELLDLSEEARRDKPLSCSTIKSVMHEHGVNLRFLSAVFKCIVSLIEARAKSPLNGTAGSASDSFSPEGMRRQSTRNNSSFSGGGGAASGQLPGSPLGPAKDKKDGTGATAAANSTPKKQPSMIRKQEKKKSVGGLQRGRQESAEHNRRQISTLENNIALHLIRVEAVARSFRVVLNEHLRAIQEARYLIAAGRNRSANGGVPDRSMRLHAGATVPGSLSLTTLIPHPPGSSGGYSADSPQANPPTPSAKQSQSAMMLRNQQELAATSVTSRLAQSLRNLDTVLSKRAAEAGLRMDLGSTARSLIHVKFRVESESSHYLVDPNERFDRENPSLSMDDEEKTKVAELLSLLLSEDKGGALFWDHCMFAEIWLKFGFLGARNDLRFVGKAALLKRVCELCNLRVSDVDLSDMTNIVIHRDAIRLVGPVSKLIYPSARIQELSAGRYSVVSLSPRPEVESLNTFDAQESHVLKQLAQIEEKYRFEDQKKKKGIVEAQAKQMIPLLAKLERLYQYRGEERRGDHELAALQGAHCRLVMFYSELRRLWERFDFDGVLYVTCPSCSILYNSTITKNHKCDVKIPWTRKVAVEVLPLGMADGKLLNSCLSASSEIAPHSCARFARLGFKNGCWRPGGKSPDEHLLISLPFVRTLVYMDIQGSGQGDGKFLSCLQIQYSADGKNFATYTAPYRHRDFAHGEIITTVSPTRNRGDAVPSSPRSRKRTPRKIAAAAQWNQFDMGQPESPVGGKASALLSESKSGKFESNDPLLDAKTFIRQGYILGNSDDSHITRIEFEEPIKAQYFRIVVGNEDKQSAALRMEAYYESHPPTGGNPGREGQSERVVPHHVMWDAVVDGQFTRLELAKKELEILKALDETAAAIIDAPHVYLAAGRSRQNKPRSHANNISSSTGPSCEAVAADFISLVRPSTEYPALLQRHIHLLQQWGPERRNDIQVSVYELLRYRLAEILLKHERGRSGEARAQMSNYMTSLMTNLGSLGTRTTLVAPVMVLTRDVLTALGLLSSFLDTFYQVVLWAARFRHCLLPYILSVLIDAAAASPDPKDKLRVADMCTALLADESLQLAAQLEIVNLVGSEETSDSDHHQSHHNYHLGDEATRHGGTVAMLRQFPISLRARTVFQQMLARSAIMELHGSTSSRPAEMSYPDW